ncbi:MAG TPA: hypothetical protein VF944_00480 [Candidatus Bathyarchaeia archaeon]
MASKRRSVAAKAKKTKKNAKVAKFVRSRRTPKKAETKRPATPTAVMQPPLIIEPPARERYRITIENIRGDTSIGDLLVAFPRTREILVKRGLRLEAEDAGDIYMNLDAFSAMNGLKTENLVQELVETAKEPPSQMPVIQIAAPSVQ